MTTRNGSPPQTVRYDVRHTTVYSYSEPVPVCHNEIHLVPRGLPRQRLLTSALEVDPVPTGISGSTDYYGNQVGFFAVEEGHERLAVTATRRQAWPQDAPDSGQRGLRGRALG